MIADRRFITARRFIGCIFLATTTLTAWSAFRKGTVAIAAESVSRLAGPPLTNCPAAATGNFVRNYHVSLLNLNGISDIATGEAGNFWLLPEQGVDGIDHRRTPVRRLIGIKFDDLGNAVWARHDIQFHVEGSLDTESVASVGDGSFIIGTEQNIDKSDHENVEWLEPNGTTMVVQIKYPLLHGEVPHSKNNLGIEGICFAQEHVVAAIEQRSQVGEYSPLVVQGRNGAGQIDIPFRHAESMTRISALTCKARGASEVEGYVLETRRTPPVHLLRRFILQLKVGTDAAITELDTIADLDILSCLSNGEVPNFEGVAQLANGGFGMVSDNWQEQRNGDTTLLVLEPRAR